MLPFRRKRFSANNVNTFPFVYWSFVEQITANAVTIGGGTKIRAGDVGILHDGPFGATPPASSTPAGWTSIIDTSFDAGANSFKGIFSYKIIQPSDLTGPVLNTITGMDGASSERKWITFFRPSYPIRRIIPAGALGECTAGDPVAQVITVSQATLPAVAMAVWREFNDTAVSAPATMTVTSPGTTSYIGYQVINNRSGNLTVDVADTGSITLMQSFYFTALRT